MSSLGDLLLAHRKAAAVATTTTTDTEKVSESNSPKSNKGNNDDDYHESKNDKIVNDSTTHSTETPSIHQKIPEHVETKQGDLDDTKSNASSTDDYVRELLDPHDRPRNVWHVVEGPKVQPNRDDNSVDRPPKTPTGFINSEDSRDPDHYMIDREKFSKNKNNDDNHVQNINDNYNEMSPATLRDLAELANYQPKTDGTEDGCETKIDSELKENNSRHESDHRDRDRDRERDRDRDGHRERRRHRRSDRDRPSRDSHRSRSRGDKVRSRTRSRSRSRDRSVSRERHRSSRRRMYDETSSRSSQQANIYRIYVGGLHPNITEEMIRSMFVPFGPIIRLELMRDRTSMLSRGYAFITYADIKDGQAAVQALDGFPLAGKTLRVSKSNDKNDSRHGAGGSGGGRSSSHSRDHHDHRHR